MKIKIKYTKESRSKNDQIINRIYSELYKLGVDNIETTDNIITYRNTIWKFGSNIKAMTTVSKGYFEISSYGNFVKVDYTYYFSILGDILAIVLTCLLGIYEHAFFYFISLALIIQLIISTLKIKSLHKDLFERIIGS